MSEDNAVVQEQEGSEADFLAGFNPTETPPGNEDNAPDAKEPEAITPEPEYVQITREQFENITSRLDAAAGRSDLDKAFGKMGDWERRLKALQQQTPVGVEVTDEDVAELCAEYPELGPQIKAALQNVAGKLRGTGSFDPESVKPLLDEHFASRTKAEQEASIAALTADLPEWRDLMYAMGEDGVVLLNEDGSPTYAPEFAEWLAKQSPRYQKRLEGSWDAYFIGDAVEKFQKDKEAQEAASKTQPPVDKTRETRQQRVAAAVQPKGAGGNPTPASAEDDEFTAAFNSASK